MKYIYYLFTLLILISCSRSQVVQKELQMSFDYIESNWSDEEVEVFKNTSEGKATIDQHFSFGMFLRNTWINNHNESEAIHKYFESIEIFHSDDISSIILTCYHRYLNKKPLQLEDQVKFYKEYWDHIDECDQKQVERSERYFKSFNLADSLIVKLPLENDSNATNYTCFDGWEEFNSKTLLINGVLLDKEKGDTFESPKFKILVLTKNIQNASIQGKPLSPKDTLIVYLKSSWRLNFK